MERKTELEIKDIKSIAQILKEIKRRATATQLLEYEILAWRNSISTLITTLEEMAK